MALPKIVKAPAKVLTTPTSPVENIDGTLVKLTRTMNLVVRASGIGVALAANQIGRSLSMFNYIEDGKTFVVINPTLISVSDEVQVGEEGCLSIPGKRFIKSRPAKIEVAYYDLQSDYFERELEGFMARVFLHELDHLKGVLVNG
mgnify:CR=1 FL=1